MKIKKPLPIVCYPNKGTSLADIIQRAKEAGLTEADFGCVKLAMELIGGCCGGHAEGEYCYAEWGYNDIRFEVEL